MKQRIHRRALKIAAVSFILAAVSCLLLILRWQAVPPAPTHLNLGDPSNSVGHFYGVEHSEHVDFRWSRTTSAVSLPTLSSSQVISITLDPARPAGYSPAYFRLSMGEQTLGSYRAVPGFNTYTTTVEPGLNPQVRLIIDSDTFFPGAGDSRKLGMAIAEVATAPHEGTTGLRFPPDLWLVVAALVPVLIYLLVRPLRVGYAVMLGAISIAIPTVWSLSMPVGWALPSAAWLVGIASAALLLRKSYELSRNDARPFGWLVEVGHSRWELPAVAALTGGLALVLTWPLVVHLGTDLPGWPMDNFAFLYKLWWFRTAVVQQHTWPLFDPNSYAPFGFDLSQGEPTLVNTIPGILIGTLFNDVFSYNLLILLSFVISGLGAYLLVKEVTGSRLAGLLSALAFAFAPYRMAQLAGHIQLMGTGWIAFSFYFVERTLKTRSWRDGALLGLSVSLTALSAWYYAYMVGLALVIYTLARIWMLRRELPLRSLWKPLVASGVVFLLLGGVAAIPSIRLWSLGELTHSAKAADEFSASPLDYFIPNQLHPVWGEPFRQAHADQNLIESNLYLGIVVLSIAIVGWVTRRRAKIPPNKTERAWLALLVVTAILSLGLTLHGPNGQVKGPIPMPGQLLFDWLPFYSSMRAYARFGVLAELAAVVLMGVAWSHILNSGKSWVVRHAYWLTLVAICLLLADFWTSPYRYVWGTTHVEPSETAKFKATLPPGLVMQMPLAASQSGPLLFQETYYGKPIAYGYDTFEPAPWKAARPSLETFPHEQALDVLHSWGVRYVVVSAKAYGADWPGTLEYLKGLPRLKDLQHIQEHRIWDVDPALLDDQPDLLQYAEPDTVEVFELLP